MTPTLGKLHASGFGTDAENPSLGLHNLTGDINFRMPNMSIELARYKEGTRSVKRRKNPKFQVFYPDLRGCLSIHLIYFFWVCTNTTAM